MLEKLQLGSKERFSWEANGLRLSGLDRVHRISIVYNEWSDKYYLKVNPKYVFCFAFIVWRLLTNCWAIVGR